MIDWNLILTIIALVLNIIFIPLFIWIWHTDRKVIQLMSTQIKKDDLEKIYNKIDDLKESFVHVNTCNSKH